MFDYAQANPLLAYIGQNARSRLLLSFFQAAAKISRLSLMPSVMFGINRRLAVIEKNARSVPALQRTEFRAIYAASTHRCRNFV
jgi:hypothetical protein